MQRAIHVSLVCLCVLGLTACAGTGAEYRPVVDRPGPNYEQDLAACQQLAEQRSYANGDTATSTAVGAGIGAVIGGLTDGWGGAAVGAGVGGLAGGGSGAVDAKNDRKSIVIKCMQGRGYNVVG